MFNQNGLLQHVMQAWVRGFKKRISRPKWCFWVIRPRIIFHCMRDQFYFGLPSLFLFIFISTHFFQVSFQFIFPSSFFGSISSVLLCFYSFIFFQWCELNTFGTPFSHLPQAFDRLSPREDFSLSLPPVWRVILGWDIEGNLSGSKRVTMDNFSISVKG